jgi:predicted short-subunit dehydrogenase-like oxidoreductase (DUF2520 family)
VLYPLQSLRKDIRLPAAIPFLLTCSSDESAHVAHELVGLMGCSATQVSNEERIRYHLAAVLVNNIPNHLFTLAHAFCVEEKLDFLQLFPLMQETVARLTTAAPQTMQTGPAVRGDEHTKAAHTLLLQPYSDLQAWYTLSWNQIRARYSPGD